MKFYRFKIELNKNHRPVCGFAAKIVAEEITPLVPAVPGEKVTDDHICSILQIVLKVMVVQVRRRSVCVSASATQWTQRVDHNRIVMTFERLILPQASSLEWKSKENQDTGFRFLFSLFKKYYLPHLFPSFTKHTNLYKPQLGGFDPCIPKLILQVNSECMNEYHKKSLRVTLSFEPKWRAAYMCMSIKALIHFKWLWIYYK